MSSGVGVYTDFVLPSSIVSKVDVSRLVNEMEALDGRLIEVAARADVGSSEQGDISQSQQLSDFLSANSIDLENSHERSELIRQLRTLKDKVPVVHMTFATETDQESLKEVVEWLRTSVHSQAVVVTSVQPSIIAGAYIRTSNRVHDLSLRAQFKDKRRILIEKLEALRVSE